MDKHADLISKLRDFEKIVSQYPDNKEAWERVCDTCEKSVDVWAKDIQNSKSAQEYYSNVYPTAVNAAEIIHVMSTVPVYVLVQKDNWRNSDVLVAITNGITMETAIPVFFTREDAEKVRQEIVQADDDCVWSVRIPFMPLIDQEFGLFPDEEGKYPLMALCDFREGKPWVVTDKHRIMLLMLSACRALRSYYDMDILTMAENALKKKGIPQEEWDAEDEEWDTEDEEWGAGGNKPPVS